MSCTEPPLAAPGAGAPPCSRLGQRCQRRCAGLQAALECPEGWWQGRRLHRDRRGSPDACRGVAGVQGLRCLSNLVSGKEIEGCREWRSLPCTIRCYAAFPCCAGPHFKLWSLRAAGKAVDHLKAPCRCLLPPEGPGSCPLLQLSSSPCPRRQAGCWRWPWPPESRCWPSCCSATGPSATWTPLPGCRASPAQAAAAAARGGSRRGALQVGGGAARQSISLLFEYRWTAAAGWICRLPLPPPALPPAPP